MATTSSRGVVLVLTSLVGIAALLVAILLPLSFSGLEYYQYGFLQEGRRGKVITDQVYSGGNYFVGLNTGFKTFTATAHFESLHNVSVFTTDKLEEVLSGFSVAQLIGQHQTTEAELLTAVREKLGGRCCAVDCSLHLHGCPPGCLNSTDCDGTEDTGLGVYVKYLQLGGIDLPDSVAQRFTMVQVLNLENEGQMLNQTVMVDRKSTDAMLRDIQNKAREVMEETKMSVDQILTMAAINRTAVVEAARVRGLKKLYQRLGLNTQELRNSFHYLHTLMSLDNVHLSVDLHQRILGGFGGN